MYGAEAAGLGVDTDQHAATLTKGRPGVLQDVYKRQNPAFQNIGKGRVCPSESKSKKPAGNLNSFDGYGL